MRKIPIQTKAAVLLLLFVALFSSCGSKGSSFPEQDAAKVTAAVDKLMAGMNIPGVLLGLWVPGKGELFVARGISDLDSKTPISENQLFRIGSITKTFTAISILQLADENKLSLDDTLNKYDARFPYSDRITLRHLLNHTCGIYSYTDDSGFQDAIVKDPAKKWSYEEIIGIALSHEPNSPPGESIRYSNTAYLLLGKIIEKVTGNNASDEIKRRVIDKLRLGNTYMAAGPEMQGNYSHGYTYDLGNGLQDVTKQDIGSWGWMAGGLVSNMSDIKQCAEGFTDGRLLSQKMQVEFTNWLPLPVSSGTPVESFTGLGIVRYKGLVGNSGATYGYAAWMWRMPATGATLVAFFNQKTTWEPARNAKEEEMMAELLKTVMEVM